MFPAAALTLASLVLPPAPHVYVPDTDRFVYFRQSSYLLTGRLDSAGHFNELSRTEAVGGVFQITRVYPRHLVDGWNSPVLVYELRYRRLIPGIMCRGEFTPDLDARPIRFTDYHYTPTARPIWNLPGSFRPIFSLTQLMSRSRQWPGRRVSWRCE